MRIPPLKALEQEPCEDEYIKVPKKALKYRTAGMVAYNVKWLKNHFDMERVLICGTQEPKTGHWEWVQYDYNPKLGNWQCSECRCVVVECVGKEEKGGIPLYNYCPNCGCKLSEIPTGSESEG